MPEERKALDWERVRKFYERVAGDVGIAMQGALSFIGDRLGIFKALADAGSVTSEELATRTGLSERYLREWLGAMAAAGYADFDAKSRRFSMSAENAMVLANPDSPFFSGGFLEMLWPNISVAPKVAEAFRTGKGVPQGEYPPETFEAIERSSAPIYQHQLVKKWLPTMPQLVKALADGGTGLDVGCGSGRAIIAIAAAFPKARLFGYDSHPGSIERARANAQAAGVGSRVKFEAVDCTKLPPGEFDFISTFDVIHDSVDPLGLMKSIRRALKAGGTYLMTEVNVGPRLEDNLNPMGRMMYSVSTLYCMTVSLAHGGAGIGALMGEPKARELAQQAGFTRFRRLPIDNPFQAGYEIQI